MKGSHLIIIQSCWRISYFLAAAFKNCSSLVKFLLTDRSVNKKFSGELQFCSYVFLYWLRNSEFSTTLLHKKKFDPNCLLFGKTDRLLCNIFHRTILITWQVQEKLGVSSITSGQSFWPSLYHVFLYSFSSFW